MHLLVAQKGEISEFHEAIDLNQTQGDVIFLSFADSELNILSQSFSVKKNQFTLRLANLSSLLHFLSVDTYLKKTAIGAKLIVVRLLGGKSYWSYGVESLYELSKKKGIQLAILSGDNQYDEQLQSYSTLSLKICQELWSYFVEGGQKNGNNFLLYCGFLLRKNKKPQLAKKILPVGLWHFSKNAETLLSEIKKSFQQPRQIIYICFYRSFLQSGQTKAIEFLIKEIEKKDHIQVISIYVVSLKHQETVDFLEKIFSYKKPDLIINLTGFSISLHNHQFHSTILDKYGSIVLQASLANSSYKMWKNSSKGLNASDLAMNVALPEMDGRIFTRAISFKDANYYDEETQCNLIGYKKVRDRIEFVKSLAINWLRLRILPNEQKKVALLLANYPSHKGRLAHGVGLDTINSLFEILKNLKKEGYKVKNLPPKSEDLIQNFIKILPQTDDLKSYKKLVDEAPFHLPLNLYQKYFSQLPKKAQNDILSRWKSIEEDPLFCQKGFAIFAVQFENLFVALQPDRTFSDSFKNLEEKKVSYHDLTLAPTHHYMAFYFWLRHICKIDVCVHLGKHGNLEWLPGKSLALSKECFPELALGATPHIYPFIVNDPGEALQAKRRSSAVIIGHLTPPLTRVESYGALKELEILIDEYYQAASMDERRLEPLKKEILSCVKLLDIEHAIGEINEIDSDDALLKIDSFLCDLKELQIRNGLHIFGKMPNEETLIDFLFCLAYIGDNFLKIPSLVRAISNDLLLDFDPLTDDLTTPWKKSFLPDPLKNISDKKLKNLGDVLERVEIFAKNLIKKIIYNGSIKCYRKFPETNKALRAIKIHLLPKVMQSAQNEMKFFLSALNGYFVPPGPSGAPTRGNLSILPTGRNIFGIDIRSMPTRCAWQLGKKTAELLVRRYIQDHGEWPKSVAINVWGTTNIRSGGDDIAQALALVGAKPIWSQGSNRVEGYEIIPLHLLKRPRIDVFLRVSGFFRDSFPEQMLLFQEIINKISKLDELDQDNFIAYHFKQDRDKFSNLPEELREKKSSFRIFTSKRGTYGTGVSETLKNNDWEIQKDLGDVWFQNSSHVFDKNEESDQFDVLSLRLSRLSAIIQNQDNREHDLLDSAEYSAFQGGMAAAASCYKEDITIYHNDLSRTEKPVIKTLEEELSHILHARALNPKWIKSMHKHGYRGGGEMCAVVDYLFAFSATTKKISHQHFLLVFQAYLQDEENYQFLEKYNLQALKAMAKTFDEAIKRGLWNVRKNSVFYILEKIKALP